MSAPVRYALRTLAGPWATAVAVPMEVADFLRRGSPWLGEGMWTVEWFGISLFIVGPLAAGFAAVDASRLARPGNLHLVAGVPRPYRVFLRAGLWCAVPLVVVHLAAIVAGLVAGRVGAPAVGWPHLALAASVQSAVIVWYVAFGSFAGRFVPPVLAGLLGGGAAFVLSYAIGDATSGTDFRLLAAGVATISRVGKDFNPAYLGPQLALLVVTAAVLTSVPVRSRLTWKSPSRAGGVAVVAVVALLATAQATLPAGVEVTTAPQAPTYCVGAAPRVCVYPEHRRYAQLLAGSVRTLTAPAAAAGYTALVPAEVHENSRSYIADRPGVAALWLPADVFEHGTIPLEDVAYQLVAPAHCAGLREPEPPSHAYDVRFFSVLATWLRVAGLDPGYGLPAEVRQLSPAEVATVLAEFQRCDLDGPRR